MLSLSHSPFSRSLSLTTPGSSLQVPHVVECDYGDQGISPTSPARNETGQRQRLPRPTQSLAEQRSQIYSVVIGALLGVWRYLLLDILELSTCQQMSAMCLSGMWMSASQILHIPFEL